MTGAAALFAPLASIWIIAALAWSARRATRARICPICAGVAGTWIWLLILKHLGTGFDTSLLPILMGGSVVGVAYQLERLMPEGRSAALWKLVSIPLGFAAAYALQEGQWALLAAITIALGAAALAFFLRPNSARAQDSEATEELKQQLKRCC